jgi:peptide/nickel transport system substrate-binding protein
MSELPLGTVTLLFTDIEGSTRMLSELQGRYAEVLAQHDRVLREAFAGHGGHEVDTQGDAFYVAFARAGDAIAAAVEAQRALAAAEWPTNGRVSVRMGLHTGEPAPGERRYVGLGVHRAARICAAGHGGQVLLSSATHELLTDDMPAGLSCKDLGKHRLKDFDRPERVFQLVGPGMRREFPPLGPAKVAPRWRSTRIVIGVALLAACIATAVALWGGRGSSAPAAVQADAVAVIDPVSARLMGQIPVGAAPSTVASGPGGVWVVNAGGQSVTRIDPVTRTVRQTVAVGNGPAGLAAADGAMWVAAALDGRVARVDGATDLVVQHIPVGTGPTGVAAGAGAVWVANSGEQSVSRIDPADGRPRTVDVGVAPSQILATPSAVWVTSAQSRTVSRIDPHTLRVVQIVNVGGGPASVIMLGGDLWVANELDGTVSRINSDTGSVKATIPVGNGVGALAAAAGAVWVSEEFGGTVDRIDVATNTVSKRIAVGNRPTGLAVIDGKLWVAVRASGDVHRGDTLRVLSDAAPGSIDPAVANSTTDVPIMDITNDGLTKFRHVGGPPGAEVVPDLAVSLPVPTDGGRSYRFVLRPGVRYSTGGVVQPADVRASFERIFRTPDAPGADYLRGLVGGARCIRTPQTCDLSNGVVGDGSSVTLNLSAPDPDLLQKLATTSTAVLPRGTPARTNRRRPLPATGPYTVSTFTRHGIRLVRNPRFREWSQAAQPDGYPDVIEIRSDVRLDRAVDAIEHGRADDAGIPAQRFSEVATRLTAQTRVNPQPGDNVLFLNTRVAPFDDIRVRQALNAAVDRRAIVRAEGGRGAAAATCQILPPNFPGYVRYCPYQAPDLRKARRLVAASGTRGTRVTVSAFPQMIVEARFARALLQDLGYRASLKVLSDAKYFRSVSNSRSRTQIGPVFWGAGYSAPSTFFDLFSCRSFVPGTANLNWAEFCDPGIDRLIRRALAQQTVNAQLAEQLWATVDRRIVNAAPWVPLTNPRYAEFVSKRVGNYQFNPATGSLLDQMWLR